MAFPVPSESLAFKTLLCNFLKKIQTNISISISFYQTRAKHCNNCDYLKQNFFSGITIIQKQIKNQNMTQIYKFKMHISCLSYNLFNSNSFGNIRLFF